MSAATKQAVATGAVALVAAAVAAVVLLSHGTSSAANGSFGARNGQFGPGGGPPGNGGAAFDRLRQCLAAHGVTLPSPGQRQACRPNAPAPPG